MSWFLCFVWNKYLFIEDTHTHTPKSFMILKDIIYGNYQVFFQFISIYKK